jgi:5-deoxy-glucuronate isomerase
MKLRYQASGQEGYEVIFHNHEGLEYINQFGILRLGKNHCFEDDTGPCEAMLHVIEGSCSVFVNGDKFANLAGRPNPFQGKPTAVYLPPGVHYAVEGQECEIAVTQAKASQGGEPYLISPDSLSAQHVGRDNWQRTVTMIANADFMAEKLILGETVNPPGNWSGVPTHKHDTHLPQVESYHEELYYFRVDRPGGWGIERIYDKADLNQILLLQDRVVTIKPRGYHTIAAAPGFTLYYAFVLAGPAKTLLPRLDPDQAWIAG